MDRISEYKKAYKDFRRQNSFMTHLVKSCTTLYQKHIPEEESIIWSSSKLKYSVLWNTWLKGWKETIAWEKIFANHIPNERLVSKIYEELANLKVRRKQPYCKMDEWTNTSLKRWYTWKDD